MIVFEMALNVPFSNINQNLDEQSYGSYLNGSGDVMKLSAFADTMRRRKRSQYDPRFKKPMNAVTVSSSIADCGGRLSRGNHRSGIHRGELITGKR
jgi:hypothetical protein